MSEPFIKGVIVHDTSTNSQVVHCSQRGCSGTLVFPIKGSPMPGDQVLNAARRRGWHVVGTGAKVRVCPDHKRKVADPDLLTDLEKAELLNDARAFLQNGGDTANNSDRRAAMVKTLKSIHLSKVTDARTKKHRDAIMKEIRSTGLEIPAMEKVSAAPTPDARAQRRKVFYAVEEAYGKGGYCEGATDESIAARLHVAVGMVKDVREMNFGPAGPDPKVLELRKALSELESRIEGIETAALAAVERAEKLATEMRRDAASLLNKIVSLEGGEA